MPFLFLNPRNLVTLPSLIAPLAYAEGQLMQEKKIKSSISSDSSIFPSDLSTLRITDYYIMERRASLDRKLLRTQELPSYPPKMKTSGSSSRSCLTWSLVGTVLLALVYILRPNIHLPVSWIAPIHSQHSTPNEEESRLRPRIALHPEGHVFRSPTTHYLDWRVTSGRRRPDGVLKQVFLINGTSCVG